MESKEVLLTPEGLQKLEKELDYLKRVRRKEVADRIKQALEFGDISENSEYEDAKNEQAFVEGRILTLEKMLRNARLISEEASKNHDEVSVGSKVVLRDIQDNSESEYLIVGSAEADPLNNRISNESPVGKAVLGKRPGDVVEVRVPDGVVRYQIITVNRGRAH